MFVNQLTLLLPSPPRGPRPFALRPWPIAHCPGTSCLPTSICRAGVIAQMQQKKASGLKEKKEKPRS